MTITKIKYANVELDVYTLLMKIETPEDLKDAIELIKGEFNKNLGNVQICLQVKNLICVEE